MNTQGVQNSVKGAYKPRIEQRVLIMTAVPAERDAVLRGLGGETGFDVLAAGVGPVATAVQTAKALTGTEYSLVISAGIGGGFPGKAGVGSWWWPVKLLLLIWGRRHRRGFAA
ncbi:hypothetical protein N752_18825 [Desulforamulus aquiferis]|nr:hypothetical protein N752_18825 [Desulforamulus aquiferis]